MEKDEELTVALLQLEGDVGPSLRRANHALEDGLWPLAESPSTPGDLSAATYKLRWQWQDELARVLEDCVMQLCQIGAQHQVQPLWDWIEDEFRRVLRLIAVEYEPPEQGPSLKPLTDGEFPGILAHRPTRPAKLRTLRGELLIDRGNVQLRIPVTVSAHLKFLKIRTLRSIQARLRQSQRAPAGDPHLVWIFRKRRLGWSVGTSDRLVEFPDLLGMIYLQTLLRNPGLEISVGELVAGAQTIASRAQNARDPAIGDLGSKEAGQEILDKQAKGEFRRRIEELKRDAEIAHELHDVERLARIREEQEWIEAQLKSSTGLGGRQRKFTTTSDNQRVSVRKAASKALERISQRMPDVGEHLKASINFGFKCCYRPVQQRTWQF